MPIPSADRASQPTPGLPVEDLALTMREFGRPCLSCIVEGYRYHIWLDADSLRPDDDTLFKNPPEGATFEGNRRGRTLHLSQSRGIGAKLVPLMLAAVPDLLPGARSKMAAEIADRAAKSARDHAIYLAKENGPELLEALQDVLREEGGPGMKAAKARARAAIARATGASNG